MNTVNFKLNTLPFEIASIISKHLDNIDKKDLYIMLSNILIEMSMKKTDNDYSEMKKLLGGIK